MGVPFSKDLEEYLLRRQWLNLKKSWEEIEVIIVMKVGRRSSFQHRFHLYLDPDLSSLCSKWGVFSFMKRNNSLNIYRLREMSPVEERQGMTYFLLFACAYYCYMIPFQYLALNAAYSRSWDSFSYQDVIQMYVEGYLEEHRTFTTHTDSWILLHGFIEETKQLNILKLYDLIPAADKNLFPLPEKDQKDFIQRFHVLPFHDVALLFAKACRAHSLVKKYYSTPERILHGRQFSLPAMLFNEDSKKVLNILMMDVCIESMHGMLPTSRYLCIPSAKHYLFVVDRYMSTVFVPLAELCVPFEVYSACEMSAIPYRVLRMDPLQMNLPFPMSEQEKINIPHYCALLKGLFIKKN